MKTKLIAIGAYLFGAIAVVTCGFILGSSVTLLRYSILVASSVLSLRLYWLQK